MGKVTGVGGVFLRSADPKALQAWYVEHLGFVATDYGVMFSWAEGAPKGDGMTIWSGFAEKTEYFGPGAQAVMINYRVDNLDELVEQLTVAGVWVDPKRQDEGYGKFAWIKDCDGNRVELWEPSADEEPAA